MLEELMRECRNWFVVPNGVHLGAFTIKDGSIAITATFTNPQEKSTTLCKQVARNLHACELSCEKSFKTER